MMTPRRVPARRLHRRCLAAGVRCSLLGLLVLPVLGMAQLTPAARKEIDLLLSAVGTSGCEFMRGGTAHSAAAAQQHLQQKYEYLASRDGLNSTEDFIAKAATRSSMTGEAYGIRCAGSTPLASEAWMKARLRAMRATGSQR